MGFLSKLFGTKDETDELIAQIRENQKRIKSSSNYQFCCVALRDAFYESTFSKEQFYNNKDIANRLVLRAIEMCTNNLRVRIPSEYRSLPVHFIENKQRNKFGFILEFSDARYECECNYVAMIFEENEKRYYTSEYYASDNSFALGMFVNKNHISFGDTPQSLEEFKNAVLN